MSIEPVLILCLLVVVAGYAAAVFIRFFAGPTVLAVRISKGDTRCRDCGSAMVERAPNAPGARRHYICEVCGYFDSFIDRDRVEQAQKALGITKT